MIVRRGRQRHIRTVIVTVLIACNLWTAIVIGQSKPVTKAALLPEVAGIRPGISVQDAYKILNAHIPKGTIKVGQMRLPVTGYRATPVTLLFTVAGSPGSEPPEVIQLELTLPPEPQVVWAVLRRVIFEPGKEPKRTSLLSELQQKYGHEGYGMTTPIVNAYWVFDEQGKRAETGGEPYRNCATPLPPWDIGLDRSGLAARSSSYSGYSLLLERPVATQSPCKPLVHVKALFQPAGAHGFELIEATTVGVIDAALASRAQAAVAGRRKSP